MPERTASFAAALVLLVPLTLLPHAVSQAFALSGGPGGSSPGGSPRESLPRTPAPARPPAADAYAGLQLRDIADGHVVVSWILPGPLGGTGLAAPDVDLARPDLVVAVDGNPMTASGFEAHVASLEPGTTIVIEYRRAVRRGGTVPTSVEPGMYEAEVRRLECTLEARDAWAGSMRVPCPRDLAVAFGDGPRTLDAHAEDSLLGAVLADLDLADAARDIEAVFAQWAARDVDYHMLPLVHAGFVDPWRLPEIADAATAPLRALVGVAARPGLAPEAYAALLDTEAAPAMAPVLDLDGFVAALDAADRELAVALGPRLGDRACAKRGLDLLAVPARTFYIQGPSAADDIAAIRAALAIDFDALGRAFAAIVSTSTLDLEALPVGAARLPVDLVDAVTGPVRAVLGDAESGWIVVGGDGANTYDLARLRAVIDPAGDDVYRATDLRLGNRVVIDGAGNDRYEGTPRQGPASAVLGAVLVDDRGGDDEYRGATLATGAALYGAALLLDRGGADVYRGGAWSIGAACYGAGLVVDLGGAPDTYLGDFLTEGVGGPRGLGAIVDDGGRDLYRANGPTRSAYSTPAVYQSFSQGMGFGYRQYAAGGIGAIVDLGGDDRYEAGEFAQGGAYYYALGVLHDAGGHDVYYGNRYGQGFGVHQALGALVDDGGDDTYWSMTAASQGAAWDIGAGLLLDRAGDDSYQCDGLGQGGASMQAIGILMDLAGRDRYVARGGAIHGGAGSNTYHAETGAMSLGVFIDLGGAEDHHSSDRANGTTTRQGMVKEESPGDSPAWGVFIDR